MCDRCTKPDNDNYLNYGARGITVCDRWLNSFEAFYEDMGERPKGKTLDRINNNAGYAPNNCRWATIAEQARNKRDSRLITCKGKTMNMIDWAKEVGIPRNTIGGRLSQGLTVE